ncbi:hypothetical protein BASA60_003599 [Batrachochytrium salamandrivorans]|nr:hypothetical protein BASA60_003599 [Batrachochytrium salamandrivorans]
MAARKRFNPFRIEWKSQYQLCELLESPTKGDFDNVLGSTIATSQGPVFVLFFGTEVSTTGESWCPDCVIADPLIRRTIARIPDAVLVEAPAGGRGAEYKGSLYRSHPDIKLVAVPTLILWGEARSQKTSC